MNLSPKTCTLSMMTTATILLLFCPSVLAKGEDQLEDVTRHMEQAHDLLKQSPAITKASTTKASAAQEQAITGLDAIIDQLTEKKKKCQGNGQCKPSDSKKPKPSEPSKGKKPGEKPGSQAATSAPLSSSGKASQQLAATKKLVKDLWGHLPERQQEQILQPLGEEFLPKYAEEIAAYFRALAEPQNTPQEVP